MKTTVDIPNQVMEEALAYTCARTKKEAVRIAVEDFNRRQRLKKLADQLGTFDGFLTPEELETQRALDLSE